MGRETHTMLPFCALSEEHWAGERADAQREYCEGVLFGVLFDGDSVLYVPYDGARKEPVNVHGATAVRVGDFLVSPVRNTVYQRGNQPRARVRYLGGDEGFRAGALDFLVWASLQQRKKKRLCES